ncbi:MAG: PLP-dependent aminotransferase family protein [Candidatus Cohnella colombiensis]|uniref:PLP-dependent aminotransferase family protein n=1 Tax=Candidatus Cohnella colombiensis TaxID=3121368 RepID=A0AA95F113_9BACL|nr:MAG: PLP-dependent aminotransferase family protein [Cohnella sp.]
MLSSSSQVRDQEVTQKMREQLAQGLLKGKTGGNVRSLEITAGAEGALLTLIDKMTMRGDVVIVERLTSRAALQAFRREGLQIVVVASDRHGMDAEALTTALYRYRPKFVYVNWSCSDPEGVAWSTERKHVIRHRCHEAGIALVTDDRQEMLLYDSAPYSEQKRVEPGVISIGQLPPGIISGTRVGWLVSATDGYKQDPVIPSNPLIPSLSEIEQQALSHLLTEQPLEPLVELFRIQCKERMRKITELLKQKCMPDFVWTTPRGGLNLWVVLPSGLDGEALLRGAWLKGLLFQPGGPFYASDPLRNTVRLTYAFADERQMKLGVSRLMDSIEEFTGRWSIS